MMDIEELRQRVKVSSRHRDALFRYLERRAELLRPSEGLIVRALSACADHETTLSATKAGSDISYPPGIKDKPSTSQVPRRKTSRPTPNSNDQFDGPTKTRIESEAPNYEEAEPTVQESAQSMEAQGQRDIEEFGKRKKRGAIKSGKRVKGYIIQDMLGKGGMGQVYRATQLSMKRQVAFKVLSPKLAENESFRRRFLREAQSAGRLHHKNLIGVHEVDEYEGALFFSMELVKGQSIGDLLDEENYLDDLEALSYTRQALEGLIYAHERNVIHRDIKPDNLMLTREGIVKIADLGLSRIDDDGDEKEAETSVTVSGVMMGTPNYMPPEQSRDAHTADHRSDIYSLGATLYHMVCGRVPFDGNTPMEVVINASTHELTFPTEPVLPNALKSLIRHMMAKEPEKRPQSSRECLALLKKLEQKLHTQRNQSEWYRRWQVLVPMAIVALLIILLVWPSEAEREYDRLETSIRTLIDKELFADIVPLVDSFKLQYPVMSERCDVLSGTVISQWNSWSLKRFHKELDEISFQIIGEKDFVSAETLIETLRKDQGSNLSPEVESRLHDFQKEVNEWKSENQQDAKREKWFDALGYLPGDNKPSYNGDGIYIFKGEGKSGSRQIKELIDENNEIELYFPALPSSLDSFIIEFIGRDGQFELAKYGITGGEIVSFPRNAKKRRAGEVKYEPIFFRKVRVSDSFKLRIRLSEDYHSLYIGETGDEKTFGGKNRPKYLQVNYGRLKIRIRWNVSKEMTAQLL